jgi:hypothetical protein
MEAIMNRRLTSSVWTRILLVSMWMAGASALFAAEPPATPPPSREQRERMAAVHEKMAACLRSDKEFSVCRDEMQKSCREMSADHGCPMMSMGMEHGRMGPPPERKPDSQ